MFLSIVPGPFHPSLCQLCKYEGSILQSKRLAGYILHLQYYDSAKIDGICVVFLRFLKLRVFVLVDR